MTIHTTTAATVTPDMENSLEIRNINKPKLVVYKNKRYYRNNGVWYVLRNNRYVSIAAPVGVRINTLPRGYKVVKVRGVQLYKYKGVYYKRSGRSYVIVNR
ncbi:hypothetical protein GCM10022393_37620 [Aquimarina addita]|uniref:Uncharacterized protein n=2 Tax=Aquimarina addita TaxID=870485 RepID=A0ABP6USK5_9FLAO